MDQVVEQVEAIPAEIDGPPPGAEQDAAKKGAAEGQPAAAEAAGSEVTAVVVEPTPPAAETPAAPGADLDLDEDVLAHPLARSLQMAAARIILQGVADIEDLLGHGLGAIKIRLMLRGSASSLVRKEGLDHLPLYGYLAFATSRWLDDLMDRLFALGQLERVGALRPVVRLTARGEEALFDAGNRPAIDAQYTSSA